MMMPDGSNRDFFLSNVQVRPVQGQEELRHWDRLVREHHYLPYKGLFGQSLRHVALHDDQWLALIGWTAGAFKVGARDRWIGWSQEQQFRRLKLIANNSRFVLLTNRGGARNLASRVLGLSLRRVVRDMHSAWGFTVVMAETFVDPSRFSGTCYRASNWQLLGLTRGFSRLPGSPVRWQANGQPKEVYMYLLEPTARAVLTAEEDPVELGVRDEPMSAGELRSLRDFLDEIPDFRKARGQRYGLSCYLTVMIAARLAGYRGVCAFSEFARDLEPEQCEAVGGFFSPSKQRYTMPAASTFHYVLSHLHPDALEDAFSAYIEHRDSQGAVAMDGKVVRGASKQSDRKVVLVAAMEHGKGTVLGQVGVEDKSNEIPAVRKLSRKLNLAGRTVTLDAMHAQQETTHCLIKECGAEYLITAVKSNQKTTHEDLKAIDWSKARQSKVTVDKDHGRIDTRRCYTVDLTGKEWDGSCNLFGRRQAIRIERERFIVKTGKVSRTTTFGLTSLDADKAGPDDILQLARRHWCIENRVHYVRDYSYDEDRCQVSVNHLPQNLAALSNIAISIIRLQGRSRCIPPANRRFARKEQEALDAVMVAG